MKYAITLICVVAFALFSSNAFSQISYDETSDGDLGDLFAAPTQLTLGVGVNTITGSMGSGTGGATNGTDADYFFFSLGANEAVDSISITRSGPGGVGGQSFIGYINGSSFAGQTAGDVDSFALFGDGETLLPGSLIAASLVTGDHAFWIQETAGATDYSVSLNLSAVPEPSSAIALIGLGLAGLIRRRR